MPILALAVVALVVWLLVKRDRPVHPVVRAMGIVLAIVCAAALALRVGPVGAAVLVTAAVVIGIWFSRRGNGGDDRGHGGPDAPDPPDPDPGPGRRAEPPADVLDPEAFDRARAEWGRELPKRG